jgi:agarase
MNNPMQSMIPIACSASLVLVVLTYSAAGQNVQVDVNLNMKHSVGGVSDFGRQRHITLHANLTEPDWNGEADKMNYLMNDLDVYFGRDNGMASWIFQATPQDPQRADKPDLARMAKLGEELKDKYDQLPAERRDYEARSAEMILGTNPHPTFPTLSYHENGWAGSADDGGRWMTKDIETSAEWVVEFLDNFFAKDESASGPPLPKYWEVINEPDMILNTGKFMFSSWEDIWEYHNLVAVGLRERLGENAPLVGGMTWGLHDLYQSDLSRHKPHGYTDKFYGKTAADEVAKQHARKQTESSFWGVDGDWFQWDVIWKGFIDAAGANMDFYSIHFYDWPSVDVEGAGVFRSGAQVEATLEMVESYQQYKYGESKPILISEYGAIVDQSRLDLDPKYVDWIGMRTYSRMLMQFLERPHLIRKSMPFIPVKATWGDYVDAQGKLHRYPPTMMNTDDPDPKDPNAKWYWRENIKWFELWSDVTGTRIDTRASDLDLQVDAYVDGKHVYLLLNNLEWEPMTVDLTMFGGQRNQVANVRQKQLYLDRNLGAKGQPVLKDETLNTLPESVILESSAMMILDIEYEDEVRITESSTETKYFGESLTGGAEPQRVTLNEAALSAKVNNVSVPDKGEAMLRITGKFFYIHATTDAPNIPDDVVMTFNGHRLAVNPDWRGPHNGAQRYHAVLEVPVPLAYLKENNDITVKLRNQCVYSNVNLLVWEMSAEPGRSKSN